MIQSKNSAKAVITRANNLLLLKKQADDGTLPGGTQEPGETLLAALQREVREEVNAVITPGPLLAVYEHQRPSRKQPDLIRHKVEFAFACDVPPDYQAQMGPVPDSRQVDVVWVPLDALPRLRLQPSSLADKLAGLACGVHLGYASLPS